MTDAPDPLDRAVAALAATPTPPPPPGVEAATLAALAAEPAPPRRRLARAVGLTAALAATVALVVVLGTGSPAVALQDAVQKAKNAKSVKYVTTFAVKHPAFEPQVSTHYLLGDKMRVEEGDRVRIADFATNRGVFLYPADKYAWPVKNTQKFESPLAHFNRFLGLPGEKEGADEVAGVKADRYRVRPPRRNEPNEPDEYRVWVDPRGGWPVKVEARGKLDVTDATGKKEPPADYTRTDDRFEWDAALDPKLFTLDPPAGWTVGTGPWELWRMQKK